MYGESARKSSERPYHTPSITKPSAPSIKRGSKSFLREKKRNGGGGKKAKKNQTLYLSNTKNVKRESGVGLGLPEKKPAKEGTN